MEDISEKEIEAAKLITKAAEVAKNVLAKAARGASNIVETKSKMPEENHSEILRAIGRLEGTVSTGFENVNNRLAQLNGKVADHEKRLGAIAVSDGQQNVKLGIIGTVGGLIGALVLKFIK